jgi:hypothetical protein
MFALISPQHGHKHLSGTFLLTENSASSSWTVLQVSSSLEALSLPRLHKETSSVIGDSIVLVLVLVVAVGRGGHVNTFRAWATVKQSKARDEEINTPTFLSLPTETYLPKILRQPDRILSLRRMNERVSLFQYMTTTSSPVVVSRNIVKRLEISMFIGRNALALLLKQ